MLANHPDGALLRYPMLYGPNNARPQEWSVIRRLRDGRRHMVLAHGGIMDALRELVESYRERPDFDPSDSPSFTDRFDYATEDALIDAWRHARHDIETAVRQRQAPPVHAMPHPREPGRHDHRGR